MTHVIAAAILTLGILSPIFFSCISSDTAAKHRDEARALFYQWLSMVSGCIMTVILSALFYGYA